jgi:flavorubredoxin
MKPRKIAENIYWVGTNDWDARLFDALIPTPRGTSYNSYLIRGSEKTALIDTVEPHMSHVLMEYLANTPSIDYVISLHAEQDHSGSIQLILEKYPEARLVTNPRCRQILTDLISIPEERILTIADGETLSLGDKTLKFIYIPWVHWPETMAVHALEDNVLFSTDLFGAHLATTELYASKVERIYDEEARRYFAEIMMPLRHMVQRNLDKLKGIQPNIIAPSHGPIHDQPERILDLYRRWTAAYPHNKVVMPFVSMHGSTERMVTYFIDALADRDIRVERFDMTTADTGNLAMALIHAPTLVIGTPTVLGMPHPSVIPAAYLTNLLKPNIKFVSIIGSYGWGGKTVEKLTGLLDNLEVEMLSPVLSKGHPDTDDRKQLDQLAALIAQKHHEIGLN